MTLLLWFLLAYAVAVGFGLLVYLQLRRRRSRRAWQAWHGRQRATASAWHRLFGRSQVRRLTHVTPDASADAREA